MISWLYVHVKRNRSTCGTLAAALVCRLLQMTVLGRPSHAADSLFDSYLSMNAVDFATFLFIPLFCVGQMRSLKLYSSPQCALALGSRSRVALRICADCVLTGLLMSVFATGDFPHCSVLAVRDDSHVGGAASRRLGSPRRCVGQCRHGELSCYVGIPFLGVLLPDGHFVWDVGFMAMNVVGGGSRRLDGAWQLSRTAPVGRRSLSKLECLCRYRWFWASCFGWLRVRLTILTAAGA